MKKEKKNSLRFSEAVSYGFADSTFETKSFAAVKCADRCNSFSEYRGRLGGMIAIGLGSHEATTILLRI